MAQNKYTFWFGDDASSLAPYWQGLLYLSATNFVITAVIVVERLEEGKQWPDQRPVYFISEVFSDSKQRYPHYQKLTYGVFLASRKLRHYFQDHTITMVSKAPLREIINNADATGPRRWGRESPNW